MSAAMPRRRGLHIRACLRAATLVAALAVAFAAVAEASQTTVTTDLEAWYHSSPVETPGLPPVSLYPDDTLHVGVTGGSENSRTYLRLDLSAIPADANIESGTLTLPIDPDSGTRDAEASEVVACAVTDPGEEVHGSLEPPPAVDCGTRSAAEYVDGDAPTLEVDLMPFSDMLQTGGLALVPDPASEQPAASWHVALFGRENQSENARPISARLSLAEPSGPDPTLGGDPDTDVSTSPDPPPSPEVSVTPAPQGPALSLSDPGLPGQLPSDTAGEGSPAVGGDAAVPTTDAGSTSDVAAAPAAAIGGGGFRYSVIFILPFALVAFVWYFGAALTRPVSSGILVEQGGD